MAKNDVLNEAVSEKVKKPLFSKKQLLDSKRFEGRRDLLGALLEDGKDYSVETAELIIEKYLKGKVK